MPNVESSIVESYALGSFCWVDLGTTDQAGAKTFYHQLFGWTANDVPMGPDGVYTMFEYQGKTAAACWQIGPQMAGVPPHWMLYIAVASVDEAAPKVTEHGGKVIAGPFDVGISGRMAMVEDPTGAKFNIWEGRETIGLGIANQPNTFCWADLMCPDPDAAAKFYGGVFGWTTDPGADGSGYLHIRNNGAPIGGMPPAKYYDRSVPPYWMIYFNVADVDASAKTALDAGGRTHMGPMDIPRVGRMAIIADPQGAVSCLFKESPRQ